MKSDDLMVCLRRCTPATALTILVVDFSQGKLEGLAIASTGV
jgi:hypothetical protein